MTATLATVQSILHEHTSGTDYMSMLLKGSPLISWLPKRTDYGGRSMPLPFLYAPTAGVSPTFGDAQASKADASEDTWDITTDDLFSLFSLDHKAVRMAKKDADAFIDLVESRSDAAHLAYMKVLSKYIYGTGGGSLAEIVTGGGTANLELTERSMMHVFDRNMQVTVAATDGGAEIGPVTTIGNINRQTRILNVLGGGNWNAAYSAGRHVHLRGGINNTINGLASWLPTTEPSSAAHFGVDRTVDSRLYGVIRTLDTSIDSNIEEALVSLLADVADQGGMTDAIFMNTRAVRQLIKQIGASVTYDKFNAIGPDGDEVDVSFKTVSIMGEHGKVDVVGDRNCPYGLAYALQKKGSVLISAGPMIGFLTYEDDDNKFVRHGSENAMEARIGGYLQCAFQTPGYCGVMDITDVLDDEG